MLVTDDSDTMPVERMRMRPWLEEQINSCKIPGLKWVNREKRIFQIPWMHAARHGWDVEKDAPLFRNWAIHTGKYQPGVDKPDPKTWKANFRCAMNSLPDIEEVKDKSIKKGTNAFRVYKMLSASERQSKRGKKRIDKEVKIKEEQPCPVSSAWESTNGSVMNTGAGSLSIKQEADQAPATESDTDSAQSEEDSKEHVRSTMWGINPEDTNPVGSSVMRTSLPSMSTFITPTKPNFRITTVRDPSTLSFHGSHSSEGPWSIPSSHPPVTPNQPPIHENRASVIMKTSDVSKSVKSC
ncbi:interferon regulatory factor 2 isoform X3 [Hoplias malabaricus]|uniref:interferon regulatory factor 2 isoform X3 n=1 Tax=Hoplias malabaricus TaxID=27720 RepID=UPI003461F115